MKNPKEFNLLRLVRRINAISSTDWQKPLKATREDDPKEAYHIVGLENLDGVVIVRLGNKVNDG